MRETEFIDQNKEKWRSLEQMEADRTKDPEKLSRLFIEATNDLSYSKSYYSNRSIRVYLNNLALKVHSSVYRNRQSTWARIKKLWTEQIPRAYFESRRSVLLSFLIFFAGVFIGVFSAHQDPGFIGLMLGEDYIAMTMQNIEEGKPFGVYASDSHMNLFAYITLNNIRVSFVVFVLGLFFMIGTVGALLQNGAMLGAFHYMFYEQGLLGDSLITVWMHGMPEISAIILAGAAGLELGKGLVFTNSYSRKESFLLGAKKGVLMIIGLIPVFFFAGFIEGFATRYTQMPDAIRILFIVLCGLFMISYFVIMPWRRFKGVYRSSVAEEQIPDSAEHDYRLHGIKKHGQIFSDTFALFSSTFSQYILPAMYIATAYVAALWMATREDFIERFSLPYVPDLGSFFTGMARAFVKVDQLYDLASSPVLWLLNGTIAALIIWMGLRQLGTAFAQEREYVRPVRSIPLLLWVWGVTMLAHVLFFLPAPYSVILMLLGAPVLLYAALSGFLPRPGGLGYSHVLQIAMRHGYGRLLGLVTVLFLCCCLFLLFFNSGLTDYLLSVIWGGFRMSEETFQSVMLMSNIFFTVWSLLMVIPLFIYASFFSFWSAYEIETASHLHASVDRIGIRNKAYGILREEMD
ncbi:MAG: stage II sporulation protein M [Flavobacteriales bacterium]|nr:stage II sporulation protein M [Flavobacteriales bacterium]